MKPINHKGEAIISWIYIIVALFVVMLIYIVFDQPLKENLFPIGRSMGVNNTTMDSLTSVWDTVPFLFFISLVLVGLIAALGISGR